GNGSWREERMAGATGIERNEKWPKSTKKFEIVV
ncbi:hypothetical protein PAT3040_05676, partial [Paenibacillus agaridevorans]